MKIGKSIGINFFILFSSTLFFSCSSKKNNIDFDLSNLPKFNNIKPAENNPEGLKLTQQENNKFIKDLDIFKSKDKLLSNFKIGKKDPFSKSETKANQFSSDFKLTGFLNTEIENYVLVKYLGNEGIISKNSIGGLNTILLPNGAKVIDIDKKKSQLKINFDNEDYIFEL